MDTQLMLQYWAIALALAFTPGADWAFITSVLVARRPTAPALLGLLTGYTAMILVVVAGLGSLVAAQPILLSIFTVAGAVYIVWLGIGALGSGLRKKPSSLQATAPRRAVSPFRSGILVSLLNPKGLILLLALLPQYSSLQAGFPVWVQMSVLGVIHLVNCSVAYLLVVIFIGRLLLVRPQRATILNLVAGTIMIGFGAYEIVTLIGEVVR